MYFVVYLKVENSDTSTSQMLIEDDGPSSPTWESTPLTTPLNKVSRPYFQIVRIKSFGLYQFT